jgi:hypothetical protein
MRTILGIRLASALLVFLSLSACAGGERLDPAIPIGPPSMFNARPEFYNGKIIYVRGHLRTGREWFYTIFADSGKSDLFDKKLCMGLSDLLLISHYKSKMDNRVVTIKGRFVNDADPMVMSCVHDNTLIIDEQFLKSRYGPEPR